MRSRLPFLHSLTLALALGIALSAAASPSRAAEALGEIPLPEELKAQLLSPGQLGIGGDTGDAARIFVEFVPRDAQGDWGRPIPLESRRLREIQTAPPPLATRPEGGEGMEVLAASALLPDQQGRIQTELVHWSWFHVEGLLLCSFRVDSPEGGELRLRWEARGGGLREFWDGELPLHGSVAGDGAWSVHLPRARWERPDGSRLYLGLLDLDARARFEGQELRVAIAPAGATRAWTLALVVAPSEASFRYRCGQALRMLPGADIESKNIDTRPSRLVMPAICYLCRRASAEGSSLQLRPVGDEIELDLRIQGLSGHGRLDGEAALLSGFPMARWWEGNDPPSAARFRIPRDNPAITRLIEAAAATGHVEGQIHLDTGIVLPSPIPTELDPALRRERQEELSEELLPQHLSPALLETWPNPFQERTTIRIIVPETIEQAFSFPEGAPTGLDLRAAPPFGEAPTVRVKVYNVSGKLVRILEERPGARGILQVDWDGTNLSGRPVAAGAYYISVEMGEYKVTRRVLRLRS